MAAASLRGQLRRLISLPLAGRAREGVWRSPGRERRGSHRLSRTLIHWALVLSGWALVLAILGWLTGAGVYGLVNA